MKKFKSNDNEQTENQLLNDCFYELDENITLNRVFDHIEANKPSVYLRPTKVWNSKYQFIFTCSQKKQNEIKNLIYEYPCCCDNDNGHEIMQIQYIPKLLEDFAKKGIVFKIHDQKAYERTLKREAPYYYTNFDRECAVYSRRLRCIADQEFLAAKKADEKRAYLHQASKSHESLNYFDNLSTEIILKIFNYIHEEEYGILHQVCHRWSQIHSNSQYWSAKERIYANTYKETKNIYLDLLKIKQNLLNNANCSQNMDYWLKGKIPNEYSQEKIDEIFKKYYESTHQKTRQERFGYKSENWGVVNPKYLTRGKANEYYDFTLQCTIPIQIKDLDYKYLPDYLINESKPQNIMFGLSIPNNTRMQIIDMYKYNKEIITYLLKLKVQISLTENFRGKYKVSVHILDENKIILYSYNYETESIEWNTFKQNIDIKQPFRYIIYNYDGNHLGSVTNSRIKIVF